MEKKAIKIINSIKKTLEQGPKSISEIAQLSKINWRTAKQYLELLEQQGIVKETEIKNTRSFFYLDNNNYFKLYMKEKDKKIISSIYFQIKKFCMEKFNKDPTKTQAYKILWRINNEFKLNLPIGWYLYGPCCVQIFNNNENVEIELKKEVIAKIKSTTEELCQYENKELQKIIYKEGNQRLYQLKEKLVTTDFKTKEEINPLLMDLIKLSPAECIETVTDFARPTLLLSWDSTKECFFDYLWPYIALITFKNSLKDYYKENINFYFDEEIKETQKEAQLQVLSLVKQFK